MAIFSSPFRGCRLTGEDANKFREQFMGEVMENEKGTHWMVVWTDDFGDFASNTLFFSSAEDARKAARLHNEIEHQDVAKVFKMVPGRPPAEIMV